jgi:CIC family chloride channel protein
MRSVLYKFGKETSITRILNRLHTSENTALLTLAVAVGLATGIGVWAFRAAIEFFHEIFAVRLTQGLLEPLLGPLAVVFSVALAGALVGLLLERFVGEERHHGVAGIVEAVELTGGRLPYRRMPFKAMAAALSLGGGASVGPEDPSVQIGSNLGSWFGQRLHLSEERVRLLVAAGGASGIAAAFKAPIAGVFFALEVILNGSFATSAISVVVLASVVSSAFTQAVEPGSEMGPFSYTLGGPLEIPIFVPLGFALAPVAMLFIRGMYWQHDLWHDYVHLPRLAKTALAGALVGIVAIFLPEIMGAGRETMSAILSGEAGFTLTMLLALGAAKLIMTTVSMAGGFAGGVFAPALFVGTVLGGAYGKLIALITSGGSDPQVYAIAGMAAMMTGVVRSPITAIILVFELTNDYRLILPIMLTSVVCLYVVEHLEPSGIYTMGLLRQGIRLQQGRDVDLMQGITVGEAMREPAPTVSDKASLLELRNTLRRLNTRALCVLDDQGLLCGMVTLSDLQRTYDTSPDGGRPLTVGDICSRNVVAIYPEDPLWTAIRQMSAHHVGRLPVVERETRKVVGLIGRHGVMEAYNIAIARKLQDQHTAERIRLNTLTGAHVFEVYIAPGAPIVGKQISDVHWPAESVVASIQRRSRLIVPHGHTELMAGDQLTFVADPNVEDELAVLAGRRSALPQQRNHRNNR